MNRTCLLPLAFMSAALTWYFMSSLMRCFQTSLGSPIDTQTSVWMKSTPLAAVLGSSVIVSLAPYFFSRSRAIFWYSGAGHSDFGPQMRTSMPIRQPTIMSEWPMLERVSPK